VAIETQEGLNRVSDRVCAYMQFGGWGFNNTALFVDHAATMLVDTTCDLPRMNRMLGGEGVTPAPERSIMRKLSPLFLLFPLAAAGNGVSTHEMVLDDGSRVLRHEIVVEAPLEAVWQAFTTSEGWMSWAVPFAHVDFRVGGLIETSYDPSAGRGNPANIHNRILSFLPMRMLSFQAVKAPPGFPHADLLPNLHSVVEFEAVGDDRTRVSISGVGYRAGEDYAQLYEYFRSGNAWSFEQLNRRFTHGPAGWSQSRAQDSDDNP
jgi:uncharacterized protein YndB with AHSA1/START domain